MRNSSFYWFTIFNGISICISFPWLFNDVPSLEGFPSHITLVKTRYKNWVEQIIHDDVYEAVPKYPDDILLVANWASKYSYKLRATGMRTCFSPLTLPIHKDVNQKILLIKLSDHFTKMQMTQENKCTSVWVETGATIEALAKFLDDRGCTLASSYPFIGDITVGGAISLNAHGAGTPPLSASSNYSTNHNQRYGSISNSITNFTAVVCVDKKQGYIFQTFDTSRDNISSSFLTALGRTLILSVELKIIPVYRLLCQSYLNISASVLFGADATMKSSITSLIRDYAGFEAVWYPFTDYPWTKLWSRVDQKPLDNLVREVSTPYNYDFVNNVPQIMANTIRKILPYFAFMTPTAGSSMFQVTKLGLAATKSYELWGTTMNTQLYVKPTTMRYTEFSWGILTSHQNLQKVAHDIYTMYKNQLAEYQERGEYPVTGPVETRVSGLDSVGIAPKLSTATPLKACPQYEIVYWFGFLSLPETKYLDKFASQVEEFLYENYRYVEDCGVDGIVRPEWSKGFAVSRQKGGWENRNILESKIPSTFDEWEVAKKNLAEYDLYNIFTNQFLQNFL